jgi:hypothetical protein
MFTHGIQRTARRWRELILSAAVLIFLPLLPVAANDVALRLPPLPSGRVADVNRNPTLMPNRRIYVTYGGDILFRFPNYTVRIANFRDGSVPQEGYGGLIFRNDAGMAWDGRNLILTPNYSYRLLVENRFVRGTVGDPQLAWPWPEEGPGVPAEVAAWPPEFPPLVGFRSLEPGAIEGYLGPQHGPMPQPPLVQESYVKPISPQLISPKLGADGKLRYMPEVGTER